MKPKKDNRKAMTVKVEKDVWLFLKNVASTRETSTNEIMSSLAQKYKERVENNLDKCIDM